SGDFQKRQAVLAVHIRTHLELDPQNDIVVRHCCFSGLAHHTSNVFNRINVWIAAAWVQVDVAKNSSLGRKHHEPPKPVNLVIPEAAGVDPGGRTRSSSDRVGFYSDSASTPKAVRVQVDET